MRPPSNIIAHNNFFSFSRSFGYSLAIGFSSLSSLPISSYALIPIREIATLFPNIVDCNIGCTHAYCDLFPDRIQRISFLASEYLPTLLFQI
jgi:hypothetical protein